MVVVIALVCVGCRSDTDVKSLTPAPQQQRTAIEQARDHFAQGRYQESLESAGRVLIASPDNIEALEIISSVHARKGRFRDAAEAAITLSALEVPDPIDVLLRAFDWHLRAGDLKAAEDDLRHAIKLAPDDPRVHRTMAQLLNSEGRRFESRRHVLTLARLNTITARELLSLIDLSGPFQLVSFDGIIDPSTTSMFDLGKARHQSIAEANPDEALKTATRLSSAINPSDPAVEAFRGRLIAETMDSVQFAAWLEELPVGTDEHPEYWLAIGTWLSRNDRYRESVRALGEALRLDPTDRRSLRSISASLNRLGEKEKAQQAQANLAILDKVFRLASHADADQAMWIGQQLQLLTRPWESVAWYRHAFQLQGTLESRAEELDRRCEQIHIWENKSDPDRIRDIRVTKLLGFDFRDFPMPKLDSTISQQVTRQTSGPRGTLRFSDIADSIGIHASFVSEYPLDKVDFYLHQANGGGLAAVDYDLDGLCDLYIAQSGGDPNQQGSSVPNQLYRQLPQGTFVEVSDQSETADRDYAQGVCAGDLNQDGLPDLLVANVGSNALYINQGDGTFRQRSDAIIGNADRWTSSIAIGDLNGDHLPDMIEINYLDDPLIFQRKCQGQRLDCTPQRFRAASDHVFLSAGDGTYRLWPDGPGGMNRLPNYGFGVVIADFDGQHGNDVFISNDGDVNHYWKSRPSETGPAVVQEQKRTGPPNRFHLVELAGVAGCSIGTSGISQACMGIASGDFDRNGLLDLLVTNFHNEPVNLFLQTESGFFVDEALKYGLVQPSTGVLGFGTQAADFDNDGWLDVAILNGHIYDARYAGIPFRMAAQLMGGRRGGFTLQDAEEAGPYWTRKQLGRTLALLDWNRDGKMDMVANHLDQPIAVLQNESDSQNWLQLELIGVTSDRTAIGARVVVHAGQEQWTSWQLGGTGYMCSNEPVLHFGIGDATSIDKIEISWPSGRSQTLKRLEPNRRYLLVEDSDRPLERE